MPVKKRAKKAGKMPVKQYFASEYGASAEGRGAYSLRNIKKQRPVSYDANKIMSPSSVRCDYFVFCDCAPAVTGFYMIEEKKGDKPDMRTVRRQLQAGAKFVAGKLKKSENIAFLPVLVSKGVAPSSRATRMNVGVVLRGDEQKIKHLKPTAPLPKIVVKQAV